MNDDKSDKILKNTVAQMRKGVLELCILSTIADQEQVYGKYIIDKLKESKMLVAEGTIYPLLTRLKNTGLLEYQWKESESGPPRKYYKITDQGREVLAGLFQTWNQLVHAVDQSTKNIINNE